MVKTRIEQDIIDALEPLAASHGVDLVDVEVVGATKAPCVRVRLDALEGETITLDEIAAQSGWVSDALDALDPIPSAYTLEVSSPGLARPLRRLADFERFRGERVELVSTAAEGRKSYTGAIREVRGDTVVIDAEDGTYEFALDDIKKCKLKPEIDFKGAKGRNR